MSNTTNNATAKTWAYGAWGNDVCGVYNVPKGVFGTIKHVLETCGVVVKRSDSYESGSGHFGNDIVIPIGIIDRVYATKRYCVYKTDAYREKRIEIDAWYNEKMHRGVLTSLIDGKLWIRESNFSERDFWDF